MHKDYEDNYWPEDAIFMERNSRDFVSRIDRINKTAEAICETLRVSPTGKTLFIIFRPSLTFISVKEVYYPKYSPTRAFYDECRNTNGGYGGLLSVTFHTYLQAIAFFDRLEIAKGPSLGTNFTLR